MRCGVFNLGLQYHAAIAVRIAQGAFKILILKHIAVRAHFKLPACAQQGDVADNCGVGPAIGLLLEAFQHALDRAADTATRIALNERQQFLFGFRQVSDVVAEQPLL